MDAQTPPKSPAEKAEHTPGTLSEAIAEGTPLPPLGEAGHKLLSDLHRKLLHLHKALLDDERKSYEKANGPVAASGQMLNLVMYDPYFDWLHRISETIVKIDQIQEDKKATLEDASDLVASLRTLFKAGPESEESDFMKRYKAVLLREPAAVLAHVEVQRLLLTDA